MPSIKKTLKWCASHTEAIIMYKTHKNPIALKSQFLLSKTLIELMQEKDYKTISISELCLAAGVSRKTFYRNFDVIDDIFDFTLDNFFRELEENIRESDSLEEIMHQFYRFCQSHHTIMRTLYDNNLFSLLEFKFADFIRHHFENSPDLAGADRHISDFVIGGLSFLVFSWAQNGFSESADEIAESSYNILRHLITGEPQAIRTAPAEPSAS